MKSQGKPVSGGWTFFTNHAHVLICLSFDSTLTMRDIARNVGITERAVQQIITDLDEAGYVDKIKEGRRNVYHIHEESTLRHPLEQECRVMELIGFVRKASGVKKKRRRSHPASASSRDRSNCR